MELLPTASGTRPRLACEIRSDSLVAARSESAAAEMAAMTRVRVPDGVLTASLRSGNIADPHEVSRGMRQALDGVTGKGADRSRYITLVIPDAAVRVLLIDFDSLPAKAAEALPIVRFRLKKQLPFDADQALITYQAMPGGSNGTVPVLAVAIPREVLAEYEGTAVRAGYLPGAVLPSTLAALAGLDGPGAALVVNIDANTVTTAIVRGGAVLLHRTVEVEGTTEAGTPVGRSASANETGEEHLAREWSRDDPPGYDRLDAMAAMQSDVLQHHDPITLSEPPERAVSVLNQAQPVSRAREIAQAISVASAYYEDTLRAPAEELLVAGTMTAADLAALLREQDMGDLRVHELVQETAVAAVSSGAGAARGLVAGVRGALRG